jgi:hypothetical protein
LRSSTATFFSASSVGAQKSTPTAAMGSDRRLAADNVQISKSSSMVPKPPGKVTTPRAFS